MSQQLFVLSLDGMPYTLIQQAVTQGRLPHLQRLIQKGHCAQMNSVIPTISSVAWATFATGVNPAKHNIFGFIDLDSELRFIVPNASHLRAKPLWQRLHEEGLRTIWINLPITYPPAPINGIMISGFLCTQLEDSVHPRSVLPMLKELDYMIDPDPTRARSDPHGFMDDLFAALNTRRVLTFRLLEQENWDFFMLHVMETDRLHHFYWQAKDDPTARYHADFWRLYSEIDLFIGELADCLPADCGFLILSDHGFCRLQNEVELNVFLAERQFLRFRNGSPQDFTELDPQTRAYGLIPGRLYIRDRQYERTCYELTAALKELKDPWTSEPVIADVLRREEIYSGPELPRAAHAIAIPYNGYDLKARLGAKHLFTKSHLQGMHTLDDAFVFVRGHKLDLHLKPAVLDLAPTIYALLDLPRVEEFEGRALLAEAA